MEKSNIIYGIESHHWDYENEWIPSYIETLEENGIRAIKNPRVQNVFSNKVVEFKPHEYKGIADRWEKVKSFFEGGSFSLWLEKSQSEILEPLLRRDGFELTEKYDGLACILDGYNDGYAGSHRVKLVDVHSDEDIEHLVSVSAAIWDYPEDQHEVLYHQRKSYITSPYRNGGYILAFKNSAPVAYSNYRYSSDGKVMFMNGSGVLPQFRNQGIYSDMVDFRLGLAKSKGALIATCQARQGYSSPVLKKLGFQQYSTYDYWVKEC